MLTQNYTHENWASWRKINEYTDPYNIERQYSTNLTFRVSAASSQQVSAACFILIKIYKISLKRCIFFASRAREKMMDSMYFLLHGIAGLKDFVLKHKPPLAYILYKLFLFGVKR